MVALQFRWARMSYFPVALTQVATRLTENKNKLLSQTIDRTKFRSIKIKEKYSCKKLKCKSNREKYVRTSGQITLKPKF